MLSSKCLLSSAAPAPEAAEWPFPCLLEYVGINGTSDNEKSIGEIIICDKDGFGIVLVSRDPAYPVGRSYTTGNPFSKAKHNGLWRLVTTPVAVEFTPALAGCACP